MSQDTVNENSESFFGETARGYRSWIVHSGLLFSRYHAYSFFVRRTLEAGRKAIKSNNGLQLLYRFCTNCPEDKTYDCLLSRICGIINQCLEKKELPVPEMSPARWMKRSRSSRPRCLHEPPVARACDSSDMPFIVLRCAHEIYITNVYYGYYRLYRVFPVLYERTSGVSEIRKHKLLKPKFRECSRSREI